MFELFLPVINIVIFQLNNTFWYGRFCGFVVEQLGMSRKITQDILL